ncbi:hypothetical protein NB717_003370 [Xanthomonas sacchari]|nr:hypothetical protein [Xanthomonas sacchari]
MQGVGDALGQRLRQPLRQIQRQQRADALARGLGAGQRQQLGGGAGGAVGQLADVLQRLRGVFRALAGLGALHVHAQPGQRRAQLVRGVGEEAFLQRHHVLEAAEQAVDGLGQRHDLHRDVGTGHRAEVALAVVEPPHRRLQHAQADPHAMPDQYQQRAGEQQFGRQHQYQDLAGAAVTVVQGLGHRHGEPVARLQRRGQQQAGHTHRHAVVHAVVVQHHPADFGRIRMRRNRLGAAADHPVAAAVELEEHPAVAAVLQQLPRLQGQRHALAGVVDRIRQALRVLLQVHVVDVIGVLEHQQVEQRRHHQHQQHGRNQQERQQSLAQAGVAVCRRLRGRGRAHCGSCAWSAAGEAARDSSSR